MKLRRTKKCASFLCHPVDFLFKLKYQSSIITLPVGIKYTMPDLLSEVINYRVVQKTGLCLRVNNFQRGWDRKVNYMSFGKEISWEYANNNNCAYLLWSVVKYFLKMKRVLIDCWTRLSQDTLNRAIDQLPKRLAMQARNQRGGDWGGSSPPTKVWAPPPPKTVVLAILVARKAHL